MTGKNNHLKEERIRKLVILKCAWGATRGENVSEMVGKQGD